MPARQTSDRERRVERALAQVPEAATADWSNVLAGDYDLVGTIMRDVLRIGNVEVRRGQRPIPEFDDTIASLRAAVGDEEYTVAPFPDAFRALAAGRSIRSVAHRVGLARNRVDRLLKMQISPTMSDMQKIAAGFKKPVGYFAEFRLAAIVVAVHAALERDPDRTVVMHQRLNGRRPHPGAPVLDLFGT